jgi:hypothetical protein
VRASTLEPATGAREQQRAGEDREADQCDQQRKAERDAGGEDGEPQHAKAEIQQEVCRLDVRPCLDERRQERFMRRI